MTGGADAEQAKYLAKYLARLRTQTLVLESCYVDRHYMDEYALFYSRMLAPPRNTVARIHFFEGKFDRNTLLRWMSEKFAGNSIDAVIARDGGQYLGFSCIRPISDCPIGRTVVARWPDTNAPRNIWAVGSYPVHIGNLEFRAVGIPFQQQEAAVGACATVAIWSALSHVARHEGMRAPTPAEIAQSVERPPVPYVRAPFPPTTGFTPAQVCEAIQLFGFTPVIVGGDRPDHLALALHSYLQSRIPVVLVLRGGGKAHAVTAAGFQLSGTDHPNLHLPVATRSMQLKKIYVHDDRVGPYARASLTPFKVTNVEEMPDMEGVRFEIEMVGGKLEHWTVDMIVAAVYPKIRLSIRSLLGIATAMEPMIEAELGDDSFDLRVDLRYERAGEYLSSLTKKVVPDDAAEMAARVALPRWCAVIRWFLKDEPLLELVYDTTDISRGNGSSQLVAIVSLNARMKTAAVKLGQRLGVPTA